MTGTTRNDDDLTRTMCRSSQERNGQIAKRDEGREAINEDTHRWS